MWLFKKRKRKKNFALRSEEIQPLLQWDGPEGCFATDRITVDGCRVGYMYREEPEEGFADSGWRFFEGHEDRKYMRDPSNFGIFTLNTICNYAPEIISLLNAPYGTAFVRNADGKFQKEPLLIPEDK